MEHQRVPAPLVTVIVISTQIQEDNASPLVQSSFMESGQHGLATLVFLEPDLLKEPAMNALDHWEPAVPLVTQTQFTLQTINHVETLALLDIITPPRHTPLINAINAINAINPLGLALMALVLPAREGHQINVYLVVVYNI